MYYGSNQFIIQLMRPFSPFQVEQAMRLMGQSLSLAVTPQDRDNILRIRSERLVF